MVGVLVVSENGRTVSLEQLRRAGKKGGLLSRIWLPELLVHVSAIPAGPTGKPARIGLAKRLKLLPLCLADSMRTVDLRGGNTPMPYEAARRAQTRSAAAKRLAARRQPRSSNKSWGAGRDDKVDSAETMDGCVRLVASAMEEAVGEEVGEDDDLFDAGLSSISATRLREELDRRVRCTSLTRPSQPIDGSSI